MNHKFKGKFKVGEQVQVVEPKEYPMNDSYRKYIGMVDIIKEVDQYGSPTYILENLGPGFAENHLDHSLNMKLELLDEV